MNNIITIYDNNKKENRVKILWDERTGKTKVTPDGEWLVPEIAKKSLLKKIIDHFKKD